MHDVGPGADPMVSACGVRPRSSATARSKMRVRTKRLPNRFNVAVSGAAAVSVLFWAYYFYIQKFHLGADEIYFAHVFWLMQHGQEQFLDFYSRHLPFYFNAFALLLPADDSYQFIVVLRVLSTLFLVPYLLLLRPSLWPAMLLFAIFGRMVEIRPDTVGLLLFNIAWWLLLKDRSVVLAACLAIGALFFSARAAVMALPFGLLCLHLAWPRVRPLLTVAGVATVAALLIWKADPSYAAMVVHAVYFDNQGLASGGNFWGRFVEPERLILLSMIAAALVNCAYRFSKTRCRSDAIISFACLSQLALIVIDPDPYAYVYSWAAVPVLLGLPFASIFSAGFSLAIASILIVASITSPLWRSAEPPYGHVLRLKPQASVTDEKLRQMRTPELARSLLEPSPLTDQLRTRWELCRRVRGKVLAYFWYHPICMDDALYDWFGLRWPKGFEKLESNPPTLIVWGNRGARPSALLDKAVTYDGFAISAPSARPPGSTPITRAATLGGVAR